MDAAKVNEIPGRFLCPITTEVMVDPVMDCHGHNFEREAIVDWLTRSSECPMNRGAIALEELFPNLALKEEISEWQTSHSEDNSPPKPKDTLPLPTQGKERPTLSPSPSMSVLQPAGFCATATSPQSRAPEPLPWKKLNMTQEEYDMLTTLFFTFCTRDLGKEAAYRLFRFMNYTQALDALSSLFAGERGNTCTMNLEHFMKFARKYRPQPVAEYGMSNEEYQALVQKFQGLDKGFCGLIQRDQLPQLCKLANVPYSPGTLPEDHNGFITCHDFLLWYRKQRVPGSARYRSTSDAASPRATQAQSSPRAREPLLRSASPILPESPKQPRASPQFLAPPSSGPIPSPRNSHSPSYTKSPVRHRAVGHASSPSSPRMSPVSPRFSPPTPRGSCSPQLGFSKSLSPLRVRQISSTFDLGHPSQPRPGTPGALATMDHRAAKGQPRTQGTPPGAKPAVVSPGLIGLAANGRTV